MRSLEETLGVLSEASEGRERPVVLLSDGEQTSGPDPVGLAEAASVAGVRVQTIGIGTAAGTTVQINGFTVATALDSDLLQKVATVTDGSYHQAGDTAGLPLRQSSDAAA